MRRLGLIVSVVATVLLTVGPALAESRLALVVGNSNYRNTPALRNPKNDARAMAQALKRLGFKVIHGIDLSSADMERTVREFAGALQSADVALFYYAGHGLQVKGQNYLVPIDAKLKSTLDLEFEATDLQVVIDLMEREAKTNFVFLDACRDNPLARTLARSLGASRSATVGQGLARINSGVGTLIAYSTEPGNVALDGSGRHSPFTKALLRHIETPGLEVGRMLRRVRSSVLKQTKRKQVPWDHSSLVGDFYFRSRPGATAATVKETPKYATPAFDPRQIELTVWDSIKQSRNAADFESYLRHYPKGAFVPWAKIRLTELTGEKRIAKRPTANKGNAKFNYKPSPSKALNEAPKEKNFLMAAKPIGKAPLEDWRALNQKKALTAYSKRDYATALRLGKPLAEHGSAVSQMLLGTMYKRGSGVRKDHKQSAKWYRRAAEQGNASAQLNLGIFYAKGQGVRKDLKQSAIWYRRAAEQGNSTAQTNLGAAYSEGLGVRRDAKEAVKWYRRAADSGNSAAQFNLGTSYHKGRGVTKNYSQAITWYRRSIAKGYAKALVNLGVMYQRGTGVAKNHGEALRLYRRAAQKGNATAEFNLGVMYQNGTSVQKDIYQAAKLYRSAADKANVSAMRQMGVLYSKGLGVPKDYVEAYKWGILAGGTGAKLRKVLKQSMTPSQEAAGKKRAGKCRFKLVVAKSYKGC